MVFDSFCMIKLNKHVPCICFKSILSTTHKPYNNTELKTNPTVGPTYENSILNRWFRQDQTTVDLLLMQEN